MIYRRASLIALVELLLVLGYAYYAFELRKPERIFAQTDANGYTSQQLVNQRSQDRLDNLDQRMASLESKNSTGRLARLELDVEYNKQAISEIKKMGYAIIVALIIQLLGSGLQWKGRRAG